jgi:hypothetical protein
MAEAPGPHGERGLDRELNFRAIFGFVIGLAAVTAAAFALMWGLAVSQKARLTKQDAPPPVLPEARAKSVPAGPLLQADPERDMAALRAHEDAVLAGWAWSDPAHAHARIPVERALEIVAARGFPPRTAAPAEPAPAAGVKK